MSLLFQVLFGTACRGTHHRLALDALRHLRGAESVRWTDLFLHHHGTYLTGSTAPDEQFKDYQNHVLHVGENWGGAVEAARRWYGKTVDALRRNAWSEAVYAAGVLSHYFSDPFMPLHTAQTEGEAAVHRALEWSIARSYGELQHILDYDRGGYPRIEPSRREDWLGQLIQQGAELAHEHYQAVLDHYDLAAAVKEPLAGMDQECKDRIASCLGCAVVGLARVLERAFAESAVEPPLVETTLQGFAAALAMPMRWIGGQVDDLHQRLVVEAIYDEVQRTGKVLQNLPEDDRTIRQLHADQVLRVPLVQLDAQPAEPTGTKHGQGAPRRINPNRLIASPVIDNRTGTSSLLRRHRRPAVASRSAPHSAPRSAA
ncbi:MAG: zinc dependent phospholipase C family protein [Pirellulaceae bacterium]